MKEQIYKLGDKLKAFSTAFLIANEVGIAFRHILEIGAMAEYKKKFGRLPCGKSTRPRMVKKRNKIVMDWFHEKIRGEENEQA